MNAARTKLVVLYEKMHALTEPKCGTCNVPRQCCSPEYCELAMVWAKEKYGVELKTTGHPRLPLMGPTGCTAAPHLRPLCTVHICEKHYMTDVKFSNAYFRLREKIDDKEAVAAVMEEG